MTNQFDSHTVYLLLIVCAVGLVWATIWLIVSSSTSIALVQSKTDMMIDGPSVHENHYRGHSRLDGSAEYRYLYL